MTTASPPLGRTDEERAYYALSRRVYAVFAYFYDGVVFPVRGLRRRVADLVVPEPGVKLLDVATGTGEQAFAFAEKAREVVGVDLSEAMLCVARRKNRSGNVTFQRADAADLPFADATFDVCAVSFALHEMPSSVRERVVREMVRVAKPGGTLAIVDYALPRNRWARWLAFHAIRLYERDSYAEFVHTDVDALLSSAGTTPSARRSQLGGLVKVWVSRKASAPDGQAVR